MRVLKIVLAAVVTVVAVTAGIFVVAIGAALALVWLLVRAFTRRTIPRTTNPPVKRGTGADVIDVTVSEVPTRQIER